MSTKNILFGAIVVTLIGGGALAEPKAPTVWAPPAEISGKPAPAPTAASGTPGAATAGAPVTGPDAKAAKEAKEQACANEAKAKGLKKGKKWAYIDECMKK